MSTPTEQARREAEAIISAFENGGLNRVNGFQDLTGAIATALAAKDAEIQRLTDHVDLMADEFKRIKALEFDSEVSALCERAITQAVQRVPVIEQRDKAIADYKEQKQENEELSKDLCDMEDWLLGTRSTWGACDGGKMLKERIRDLIAKEGEVGDLQDQLTTQTALLREAVRLLTDMDEAYTFGQRGNAAKEIKNFLSKPAIVELVKEEK